MNQTKSGVYTPDTEALFRKYGSMVLRRCRLLLGDDNAAADAAQEVFVKIIENKHRLNAKYPSSLLFTMATNHCLNLIRDGKRHGEGADGESLLQRIACADDVEERQGHRDTLRKLFRRSPESSRAIAVFHYVDGMTLEETAREVKMSVSGVRKRLITLRKTLAELEGVG
ncbi:MAG: RNA polymerase sigma factor [Chitinispirillales bacterium]|nr:RNA polymerase sigma factor [Chitinispirillales bacterium]